MAAFSTPNPDAAREAARGFAEKESYMNLAFFVNSALLGVGLAMDAFSVSMANGLNEPRMRMRKVLAIAATYGAFQFIMPMTGWVCVHTVVERFTAFQAFIPWIALALLGYIGGKMLWEGVRGEGAAGPEGSPDAAEGRGERAPAAADANGGTASVPAGAARLTAGMLLLQGVATSIDALSVGFAIAEYTLASALVAAAIIMAETFFISLAGVHLGRMFGTRLAGKASILGGIILVGIGLEIFVSNVFF